MTMFEGRKHTPLSVVILVLLSPISYANSGFVCVTLDWWPSTKCDYSWCPWHNSSVWAIDLEEVQPYAKLLAPFLLRIGGSLQDQYEFREECPEKQESQFPVDKSNRLGFGNGCISHQRVREISDFCHAVGCELVWGINAMTGRTGTGKGSWDSSNARELLQFLIASNAPLHTVTLGNEVWGEMVNLSMEQALETFGELNTIIDELWSGRESKRPLVGGLDGYVNRYQMHFIANFTSGIQTAGTRVDVLNFHEYPLGSSEDDHVVDRALTHDTSFQALGEKVARLANPGQELWVSECGGSFNSGSPEGTGSYASGFWYLNDMAMFQHLGYRRFCRQTLAGGNYGLLDQLSPRKPHPDFWSAVLYQKLLGPSMKDLTHQLRALVECKGSSHLDSDQTAQWYAFESKTRPNSSLVALLGINFHPDLECGLVVSDVPVSIAQYILTPTAVATHGSGQRNLTSKDIFLNGRRLVDHSSSLEGKEIEDNMVWLEPQTYGFFEVEHASVSTILEATSAKSNQHETQVAS